MRKQQETFKKGDYMILVRNIFQLKFGKSRDAIALWTEGVKALQKSGINGTRLLTDTTGPFYTLVLENTYDSLAGYEASMKNGTSSDEWRDFYQKFVALVDSGRREIFTIV
jgi:hypothetical protein